ncbi:MAG TPA: thioesterase domain-containing protein [Pseudonocardiaceae bacterium]|nr:thioesterase domain-containing protein [Pseudonocardiaceae bacterium]
MTMPTVGDRIRLHRYGSSPAAAALLYCFPHAGGSAPFFRTWPMLLPKGVALRALQLPGRQDLLAAPPFTRMTELASVAARQITADADGLPFALFGHSMGALAAFETTRELRRLGLPLPRAVGVSAARAPHLPRFTVASTELTDEQLVRRVDELGGMPAEVLADPDLIELALPSLRADFELLETHVHVAEPPLDVPLLVYGGTADEHVPPESLAGWAEHTTSPIRLRRLSGDHFYLTRWSSRIVADLCDGLTR